MIGREDEMRLEAPAVWEHGGWAVQGLQPPSGTQGRQIRRTSLTCRDATSYKSRIKRFNSWITDNVIARSSLLCSVYQTSLCLTYSRTGKTHDPLQGSLQASRNVEHSDHALVETAALLLVCRQSPCS